MAKRSVEKDADLSALQSIASNDNLVIVCTGLGGFRGGGLHLSVTRCSKGTLWCNNFLKKDCKNKGMEALNKLI